MVDGGDQVARYYDANTPSFLRYGQGGGVGVIHRAVWGDGVRNRRDAFTFVHDLLARHLPTPTEGPATLLDLGCGVGATLLDLVKRTGARGVGITNSRVQLDLAADLARRARLGDRVAFRLGDFSRLHLDAEVDLAYAVEAFVQGSDPDGFFATVAACTRPGGRLVICDDFLAEDTDPSALAPGDRRLLDEFRRGWRVASLMPPSAVDRLAAAAGFRLTTDLDLTERLELGRTRDKLIRVLVTAGRNLPCDHPRWLNLVGGNALQGCLRTRLVTYRFRVWDKA